MQDGEEFWLSGVLSVTRCWQVAMFLGRDYAVQLLLFDVCRYYRLSIGPNDNSADEWTRSRFRFPAI